MRVSKQRTSKMDKTLKPNPDASAQRIHTDSADQSRRNFAKAIAGSGVVLSLASKPVMGSTYSCTGSGGMSGNTSSHGTKVSCIACTPGYWKTCPENWPSSCYPYKVCNNKGATLHYPTKFASVFGSCAYGSDKTMMYILQNYNGSRDWHTCGAYLNALKSIQIGQPSAYTPQEIISMYKKGAPATTFSSTYEGNLHNCNLPNTNNSVYLAENQPFCKLITSDGLETTTKNPACSY